MLEIRDRQKSVSLEEYGFKKYIEIRNESESMGGVGVSRDNIDEVAKKKWKEPNTV